MIKIAQYIGFNIRNLIDKYRRDNNIPEPEEVRKLYNRYDSFFEEELSYISKLTINGDILPYLEYFPNLTEITIDGEKEITQKDINDIIKNFPNLKSLRILEQHNLQNIDVGSLSQLEELLITSNKNLKSISGIEQLKKLYSITIYDNQTLNENSIKNIVQQVNRLINELGSSCNIDVLYMPDFVEYLNTNGINIDTLKDFIVWSEHIKSGVEFKKNDLTYTTNELYIAYKRAFDIVNKYIKTSDTPEQKYAILYQWMCENVKYDHEARNHGRVHSSNGIAQGRARGINGTINALLYGSCVCQGYTKSMELLLKLSGIQSYDILCRAGNINEDEEIIPTFYDGNRHSDDSNHSIIKVNLDGKIYYSDVTWDASRYQKGEKREYFLLSRDDISKNHLLYNDESIIGYFKSLSEEEQDKLLNFASERIKSVNMGLDNKNTTTNTKKTNEELLNQFGIELKKLQEQYGSIGKKIEELMKNNSISPVSDYEYQLKTLKEQRDEIGKKIEPILESQRAFQRQVNNEKKDKQKSIIEQVEKLLSLKITNVINELYYDKSSFNGVPQLISKDSTTLRQELIDIHKKLDDLYYSGKLDIKSWQTMKKAVSEEYAEFVLKAPKKVNNETKQQEKTATQPVKKEQPILQNLTHEDVEWEAIKQKYNYDSLDFEKQKLIEQQFHDMIFKRMMGQIGVDDNLFEQETKKNDNLEDVERRNLR